MTNCLLESEISEKVYQKSYDIAKKGLSKNERSELFGSLKDELIDSYDEDTLEEKKDLINSPVFSLLIKKFFLHLIQWQ